MAGKVKLKMRKLLPVLIVLAVIVGAVVYFGSKNGAAKVTVQKAGLRAIAKTISASGETGVLDGFTARAPVGGSVKDVKFTSGATVAKGDVVLELDKASLKASLDTAYSAYLSAKSDADSYDQKLVAAKATESIRKRERDEVWRTYMSDNGETNKQAYKNAEALYQTAVSAVTTLQQDKQATQNAVYSGYSTYTSTLATYTNATVKSPADGQVALADIYAGSYVTAGQKLFTVVAPATIVFKAEIDEADISHLQSGMHATVSLDSYPGENFAGTVTSVDAKVVTLASGSAVVLADIAVSDAKILPVIGLSGSADIEFDKSANMVAISPDALFDDAGKTYVYGVVADTLVKKEVEVGFEGDEYVGIVAGVTEGDVIVTNVADVTLKEGQRVSVVTQ
jgi:membrane fusion protein (multidrug efflux system)